MAPTGVDGWLTLATGLMVRGPMSPERAGTLPVWDLVRVYPGENELSALAEGAFRVLAGEEKPLMDDSSGTG